MSKTRRVLLATAMSVCALSVAASSAEEPAEVGWVVGNAGGMERNVDLFDRRTGQLWFAITGPSGEYESTPAPPGEYMLTSTGKVAPIRIEAGRRTCLDWAGQPGYDFGSDTWSAARKKFGQTFIAFGPWIKGLSFWLPGSVANLRVELREDGPKGKPVGQPRLLSDASWVTGCSFQPNEWPTELGKRYYVSIESTGGEAFAIGTPGLGEVYPHGQAFYDDQPQLDTDLALGISTDNDGLSTTVSVTLGQGLGFIKEGPGSGTCEWAGQTFVATTGNVITAYANAGWGHQPSHVLEFIYSIHQDGPDAEQVGPERRVKMICDWGATAVWFPDQVKLAPGRRYMLKFRRADGGKFYSYLAEDVYMHGTAIRDGAAMPQFDLTCAVRGEIHPSGITYPYNVMLEELTRTSATISWATAVPSTSQLEYGLLADQSGRSLVGTSTRRTALEHRLTLEHRVRLTGLEPGKAYAYAAWSGTARPGAVPMRSKTYTFTTLTDPTFARQAEPAPRLPEGAVAVALKNPGFELGLEGWSRLGDRAKVLTDLTRYKAHGGKAACGWRHVHEPETGEKIPRKLEPPLRDAIYQSVRVQPGKTHVLSAWILTDERDGGWERNDRIRLQVDPTGTDKLSCLDTVDDEYVTQWYSTGGRWVQRRLRFVPTAEQIQIGVGFYQWWALQENHLYVDDVQLVRLGK